MTANARTGRGTTITFSVQLPQEMFHLLQDVALARHLNRVAGKSGDVDPAGSRMRKLLKEGMAGILADLVERHREGLESEAVKGGVRKRREGE